MDNKPWEFYQQQESASSAPPWERYQSENQSAATPESSGPALAPTWADVPSAAAQNLPASAKQFGSDIANVVLHPIDTAKNIGNLAIGGVQKLIPGEQGSEKYADAVGEFFAERYGGWDNLKNTMATDPVGFLSDTAVVLGGTGLLTKTAGLNRAANVATKTASVVDPVSVAGKALNATGKGAAHLLGLSTGIGGGAIGIAGKAGYEGGAAAKALGDSMRNPVSANVVDEAKNAVRTLKEDKNLAYRTGMLDPALDSPINFNVIENAAAKARNIGSFTGKRSGKTVKVNRSAQAALDEVDSLINEWKNLPPDDFHTAIGIDHLKQAVGDIIDSLPYEKKSARTAVGGVYDAIKKEIVKQAPKYAETMKGYEEASDLIREMEKTLSLNPKASIDTSLRKLQSVIRNNVNTDYGRRADLAKILQDAGATNLMEKLAGQGLNAWAPRGFGRLVGPGVMTSGFFAGPMAIPSVVAGAAASSPRLVGEAALLAGRGARRAQKIPFRTSVHAPYQLDRANSP